MSEPEVRMTRRRARELAAAQEEEEAASNQGDTALIHPATFIQPVSGSGVPSIELR